MKCITADKICCTKHEHKDCLSKLARGKPEGKVEPEVPMIATGTKRRSVEKGTNVTSLWGGNSELLLQICVPWELFPLFVLASLGLQCLFPHG